MQPHNTAMGQVRTTVPFLMIHVGLSIPQIGQMLNLLKKARGFGLFLFYLFFLIYFFIYLFFYVSMFFVATTGQINATGLSARFVSRISL
jgi:hypothetical protein